MSNEYHPQSNLVVQNEYSEVNCYTINNGLDQNIIEYLNDIVVNKLEDEEKSSGFFYPENLTTKRVRVTQKKSQTTQKIINIVKPFFESTGMEVNPDNGYIEYESYTYNGPKFVDTPYAISNENTEYYSHVNVCYIVTRKDENLKGGKMYVYEEYPSFLQTIGYEKEEKLEVKLEPGSVFLISGDTYYKLGGCSGSGVFSFIRVTLYSEKRFGYQFDNDNDNE